MEKLLAIKNESVLRLNLAKILRLEKSAPLGAANGRKGIELARRESPDFVLSVILMPEANGGHGREDFRADPATARIPFVFLTAKDELPDMDDLLAVIEARLKRVQQLPAAEIDFNSSKPLEALGLSAREAEILLLLMRGKTNKEIANDLSISAGTVRKHVENIYRKMSVTTRNAAALRAVETLTRRSL